MKIEIQEDRSQLRDAADAALQVRGAGGEVLASCSLWCCGALGHFETRDGGAAALLLEAAEGHLRESGCRSAVGPMDGNTWRSYRLVTRSDGRAPFLLEPQNPPEWPGYFAAAGWGCAARYTSSAIDLQAASAVSLGRIEGRLESGGIVTRPLEPGAFAGELQKIYAVSEVSFSNNFLYAPIGFDEFAAMYARVRPLVVPELSLIAEDSDGAPVGFVFALPDGEQVIVKTLAVLPQRRLAGLGSVLVERVHEAARAAGFVRVIHALQHQSNTSLRISARHEAKVFREYTLYEKHL